MGYEERDKVFDDCSQKYNIQLKNDAANSSTVKNHCSAVRTVCGILCGAYSNKERVFCNKTVI